MKDDIWSGAAIKKSDDPVYVNVPSWEIRRMVNAQKEDSSAVKLISGIVAGILTIACLYFSVCGPAMWHNKLVVCNGTACREYTDWKVINEDKHTGVLEVWAGGRLQKLSNGTWHYE